MGEVERWWWKKVVEREEKLEVEEAKAEEGEELNRGDGERDRRTGVLDFLEDAAIFLFREREGSE